MTPAQRMNRLRAMPPLTLEEVERQFEASASFSASSVANPSPTVRSPMMSQPPILRISPPATSASNAPKASPASRRATITAAIAASTLIWLASLITSEAQPAGYRFKTNIVTEPIPQMRWYYAVRPGTHSMGGSFDFMGQFESDAEAFQSIPNGTPELQRAFVHQHTAIVWFHAPPVGGSVAWQFVPGFHHRSNEDGVTAVKPAEPRIVKPNPVTPPLPVPPAKTKSRMVPVSASFVMPQTWTEQPFSYTAVTGQDDGFDNELLMRTGWQIWFQFLQQSNLCYRICSSNETGWHPLSAICQQFQESTNTFHVPVVNLPIDWQPAWDAGTWSMMTNLVTTADGISYKLEAQQ